MMLGAIDRTGSDGTSILCTSETSSRTASTKSYFVMNINGLNEQPRGSTAVKDVYHPEKSSSLEIRTRRSVGRTRELRIGYDMERRSKHDTIFQLRYGHNNRTSWG
jgi:predicted cupin superfamily sugar epimerase